MTTMCAEGCAALKPADFASSQEVKWCPGCGDYAILSVVKKVLAGQQADRSHTVFVSGIGCSSRFPYYMNTYGFHGIHGRAATIATGLKLARPDLAVWIVTGDGDGLSIGGNHLVHLLRRNVNVKVLLFNNRIYGLTKGQYSPTSEKGKKTKSSPVGVPENPMRAISVALGAEATFAARTIASDLKHLEYTLTRAAAHEGTAFVEIYQNCVIFNEDAFEHLSDKETRADRTVMLEHGKPMIFGKNRDKAIQLRGFTPVVVNVADVPADSLLTHDEHTSDPSLAFLLSRMSFPDMPEPLGVFRDVAQPIYDQTVRQQHEDAVATKGRGRLQDLLYSGGTWRVGAAAASESP